MQDLTAGNVALTIFPLLQKGIEYDDRLENLYCMDNESAYGKYCLKKI